MNFTLNTLIEVHNKHGPIEHPLFLPITTANQFAAFLILDGDMPALHWGNRTKGLNTIANLEIDLMGVIDGMYGTIHSMDRRTDS